MADQITSVLLLLLRVVLAGAFIVAGALKIADPQAFLVDIQNYRMVPYPVAFATALYLPWLEVVLGLALLIPRTAIPSGLLLFGLMTFFTIAIASAWWRGLDISCGCFGKSAVEGGPQYLRAIVRDLLMLAGLGVLLARDFSRGTVRDRWTKGEGERCNRDAAGLRSI